ncbi:MAG: tRNA uridine-5-carboxymethylaminomethyl(34) synthesis GTPase MnmE [Rhodobacteraceae bacterium]|nr:tRNA uridine-5-carboxymethylaminomethyl(34) synthesis GTPase MnmE [Paracoccaceae bacterium]
MDTIFALASAQGKAGVAVVRISGPDAHRVAGMLCQSRLPKRGMCLKTLVNKSREVLDQALILTFQGPASFTGEDIAELQLHGSIAIVTSVLQTLSDIEGVRLALPGEFTRRAMENGKMNLAQVEGLADLIDAETEAQRCQAQRLLDGALGDAAERWRLKLIRAAGLIEATIDFADEDVPVDVTPEVDALLASVCADLEQELAGVVIAERIRCGFEVAIVGPPNVGKSTLLNTLAGREAAITSEFEGTTRDVIEVRMDLAGLPVTLLDTAGIRETSDFVEGKGIDLAKSRAEKADIRVFLVEEARDLDIPMQEGDIHVRPKLDTRVDKHGAVSGLTGDGVDELIERIAAVLTQRTGSAGIATRERHRNAMRDALISLKAGRRILENGPDFYDVAAEELRGAIRALESLVGRIDVENLLDEIFSSFCLGK